MIVDYSKPELNSPAGAPNKKSKVWAWISIIAVVLVLASLGVLIAISAYSRRIQPYVRQQAIEYLQKRFDSTVELQDVKIDVPAISPARWIASRGRGVIIRVEGTGLTMRHKGRTDIPPMFALRRFVFHIDLAALFEPHRSVKNVIVEGLQIHVPPKGDRPNFTHSDHTTSTGVDEIIANDAELVIMPRDPSKDPLDFKIQHLHLEATGTQGEMKYEATLTNPKPEGQVVSSGKFGPWNSEEPGDSNLSGHYNLNHANLGVFPGIAGILESTGDFNGQIDSIAAKGTAYVKDFRLKSVGTPVPLTAHFDALVDGANGDTTLKPVNAVLGQTAFTTSGAVLRNDLNGRHAISLDVMMPKGRMDDVLRLGMKGPVMMSGELYLKSKITIPPQSGKVQQKLILDGQFAVDDGHFLKSNIQDKLDELSRRAQGHPKSQEIDQVFAGLKGNFHMEDEVINFSQLSFAVPGALIQLTGSYNTGTDAVDFHGSAAMDAKVSQMMTGWKRILLKPVDPFFSKNGAGTWVKIRIDGTSKNVHYGLDHTK